MYIDNRNYENAFNKDTDGYSYSEMKSTYTLYDRDKPREYPGNNISITYSKRKNNEREILYCDNWKYCINKGLFRWSKAGKCWHMMPEM